MKSRKLLLLLPVVFFLASCSRDPKVQAQRYVENGNKFYDKGKFKEASIMYRRALQKDLKFGEAYYRLALTEINLAAYGDAVRALRRAVELQPDNADAPVKLADIYMIAATQDKGNSSGIPQRSQRAGRQAAAKRCEILRWAPHRGADRAAAERRAGSGGATEGGGADQAG